MISDRKRAIRVNERGFAVYGEFTDSYGNSIRVQESSNAQINACWIFVKDREGREAYEHLGKLAVPSPHLDREQAKTLIAALQLFVDDEAESVECLEVG